MKTRFTKEGLLLIYTTALQLLEENETWGHGSESLQFNAPTGLCFILKEEVRSRVGNLDIKYFEWCNLIYYLRQYFTRHPNDGCMYYFDNKEQRLEALRSEIKKLSV